MTIMEHAILEFNGDYDFLSNFYPCHFAHSGIVYPSAEHAYQASKTADIAKRYRIAALSTAAKAKYAGRRLKMDPTFDRNVTMGSIVRKKFVQNDDLRTRLIDTGDVFLAEGNWWGDIYWGICKGEGRNMLGNILMTVREELK